MNGYSITNNNEPVRVRDIAQITVQVRLNSSSDARSFNLFEGCSGCVKFDYFVTVG